MTSPTIVLPTAILALTLLASTSSAHDFWINHGGYKSPVDGSHCCGQNDCRLVRADGVRITPGGYQLIDGQTVPYGEALASEDGDYWMCHRYDGSRRCFFAPRPSS